MTKVSTESSRESFVVLSIEEFYLRQKSSKWDAPYMPKLIEKCRSYALFAFKIEKT